MTTDSWLFWNRADVSLRRAHFLLPELMKLRAGRTLSEAGEAIRSLRETRD